MAAASTLQQRRADALAAVPGSEGPFVGEQTGGAPMLYGNAPGNVRWFVTVLGVASINLHETPPQGDAGAFDVVLRARVTTLGDVAFVRHTVTPGRLQRYAELAPVFACLAAIAGLDEEAAAIVYHAGQDVVARGVGLCRVVERVTLDLYIVRPYGETDALRKSREELSPC